MLAATLFAFVLGLIIAILINRRFFPHIIVERIVEEKEASTQDGLYLTNQQFVELVEDIAFLVPQCTIRISKSKVFFTKHNGEVIILSVKGGWKYPTANARVCNVKPAMQKASSAPDYPPYEQVPPPLY